MRKWRLQPGKMLLIDLEQGRLIEDDELKANIVNTKPYKQWIENLRVKLDEVQAGRCPARPPRAAIAGAPAGLRLHAGRHQKFLLSPHGQNGEEA